MHKCKKRLPGIPLKKGECSSLRPGRKFKCMLSCTDMHNLSNGPQSHRKIVDLQYCITYDRLLTRACVRGPRQLATYIVVVENMTKKFVCCCFNVLTGGFRFEPLKMEQ